ncbi:GAF domain-containing SpoIIE family protein phosphatase [Pseudokineococcus sp. 1T1Z-3]|uniref:GAF domain-containing SpoIIE family protein phosphatase n=1 Tax=Pseudokineococcus sp. 1T1Z-3 TaxID=3132745 RepID=UPI0030B358E8
MTTGGEGHGLPPSTPLPASPDASFDRFARLVRTQLGVPTALVSLVSAREQVLPGAVGLPEPWQQRRSSPLTHSVCQHVVATQRPLVAADVREVPELAGSLAVPALGVVAYAGVPLRDADGVVVGSLCAIDGEPREWDDADVAVLEDLGAACSSEIALRQLRARADAGERHSRLLLRLSEVLAGTTTPADVAGAVLPLAHEGLGTQHADLFLHDLARHRLVRVDDVDGLERAAGGPRERRLDPQDAVGAVALGLDAVHAADPAALLAEHPRTDLGPGAGEGATAVLPLEAGGRVVGVLVLGWPVGQAPDADVRDVAAALARYTAQAVTRAQLLEAQRSTATLLQEAMLTALPQPDHLHLVARYVPAADGVEVGGDWYDAVVMPGGAVHLVIGDVVGHDMRAAAAMGQLRSLTRSLAWALDEPPSGVLAQVDGAMHGLHVHALATCLLARVEQSAADDAAGLRRLRWSSAGHLAPLLLEADGQVRLLDEGSDLLLGVRPDAPRSDHEHVLHPGSTVLLYTDGLVERRDRPVRQGLEELCQAVRRHADLPLEELVDTLLADMVGGHGADDVALLALRAHPEDRPRPVEAGPGHL